ncbi:Terpenoid synthase [Penicillium expansum]|nr:Terpenoid synthase [Penicillium expansum]
MALNILKENIEKPASHQTAFMRMRKQPIKARKAESRIQASDWTWDKRQDTGHGESTRALVAAEKGHGPFLACVKVPKSPDEPQGCANCQFGVQDKRCDLSKLQPKQEIGADEEDPGKPSTSNEPNIYKTIEAQKEVLETQLPQATVNSPTQTVQGLPEGQKLLMITYFQRQLRHFDANIISLATLLNDMKIQREVAARILEDLKGTGTKDRAG